jgi:hypothetical protein
MCLESHQAQIEHAATGAMIRTGVTTSLYAAVLPLPDAADSRGIIVDAEVTSGCMSVGLLDLQTQRFIAVEILPVGPRLRTTLAAGHALPHQTQLVISNHRDTPAESTMMLHGVAVLAPRPQHARSHRP